MDRIRVAGPGFLATVHPEVLFLAETGIADVPAQECEIIGGDGLCAGVSLNLQLFNRSRPVFRNSQKAEQSAECDNDDEEHDEKHFEHFFHADQYLLPMRIFYT